MDIISIPSKNEPLKVDDCTLFDPKDSKASVLRFVFDIMAKDIQDISLSANEMSLDLLCRLKIKISGQDLYLRVTKSERE